MTSLVAPCPPLRPKESCAAPSFCRSLVPSCADRVSLDPSRALMEPEDAARDGKRRGRCHQEEELPKTLPFKRRPEGEGVRDDNSRASKKQAGKHADSAVAPLSCARVRPLMCSSRSKEDSLVSARAVLDGAHGVIEKQQKAGERVSCTGIRPAVQASRPKEEIKISGSARALRYDAHGLIKKEQEASERVQATATTGSPQPATKPDPHAPHDALRVALAVARQALGRRHNIYRRQREEARRELDKLVQTVEFNDPYIAPEDVLKP